MMKKRLSKGGAVGLAFAVMLSAFVIPNAYAATAIDVDANCSIAFSIGGEYEELDTTPVTVDLYKVATVDEVGRYTELDEYGDLGLASVNDKTTAADWEKIAGVAMDIVEKDSTTPTKTITIENAEGKAEDLETGMYLVVARTAQAADYEYSFTPYLISLPDNYYSETNPDDSWIYTDVATGLKAEQTDRYGDLVIDKTLASMNASLGDASFVFQIEAVKENKTVYSDAVSITFTAAGEQSLTVEHIPAGAEVTVTEVYSGASYSTASDAVQTTKIVADSDEASVSFTNEYDNRNNGGSSVVNHFENNDGNWEWTPVGSE